VVVVLVVDVEGRESGWIGGGGAAVVVGGPPVENAAGSDGTIGRMIGASMIEGIGETGAGPSEPCVVTGGSPPPLGGGRVPRATSTLVVKT
jgi:hypothetical protein